MIASQHTDAPAQNGSPLLSANGISKSYGALRALTEVDFDVQRGEIHGLCGHNGAGKSTLVKVLTGLVQPDQGQIVLDGHEMSFRSPLAAQAAGIALVDQELSLAPDLTVDENVFLGSLGTGIVSHPSRRRSLAVELLRKVGLDHLDPRMLAGGLSLGERQLVEIARVLGRQARLLILDEPTATLSDSEIERVFAVTRELARAGTSVIYISHRLGEVLELCDRVTVFREGRLVATRTAEEIGTRQELIRMMIGADLAAADAPEDAPVTGGGEIRVESVQIPGRVDAFNLELRPGEIVGLTGQVGSGTTEVLRALGGLIPDARGVVLIGDRRVPLGSPVQALKSGIAFASNDRKSEGLFLDQSIRTNLIATRLSAASSGGVFRPSRARRVATRLAEFVGVDTKRLPAAVGVLSGGNQQKVFLGRCLNRADVRVLLFDEPTRGVDVAGRKEIHELLRKAAGEGAAVLFASTEIDEVLELSNVVVTMFGGHIVATRPRSAVTMEILSADMTLSRRGLAAETRTEGSQQ